jgi:3',5'-cyclic AMP phosphodiesterase CpdA
MRTLVHLSDLHFGRIDHTIVRPLIDTVHKIKPDLVAISGDLTQRARSAQFREARAFLDALPGPQIVVPGNHDVPLYNPFARFFRPLSKYQRYITDDLEPFYTDAQIASLGLNTARSLTFKHGRINQHQLARLRERLSGYGEEITKIIVTHHPFHFPDLPDRQDVYDLVRGASEAMETLAHCRIDVLLAGHLHRSHTGHTAERYTMAGYSALVVSAGTATSTRGRGEGNSFNLLRIEHPRIQVIRFEWQPRCAAFRSSRAEDFAHTPQGWMRLEGTAWTPKA